MPRMTLKQLTDLADETSRAAGVPTDGPYYTPGRYIIGQAYGGYRVERVCNDGGGVSSIGGYGTMREAYARLSEIVAPDAARYRIVRIFHGDTPERTVRTGLTLAEAQAHCNDPETSSRTCTTATGKRRTARSGAWFEAYRLDATA